ncbi:hypothetical protein JGU66_27965 [Myxococcaceae bacterium JPH2]|nr:hypothetical protein [Myxococcaceae bacterium JPH2]
MRPWPEVLKPHGIAALGTPVRLPVDADHARTEARLKEKLPERYRRFCTELGTGETWWSCGFPGTREASSIPPATSTRGSPRGSTRAEARASHCRATPSNWGMRSSGGPPAPRVVGASSAELFLVPDEPTDRDAFALYALDHRTPTGTHPRLVKLAQSFSALLLEGFVGKRLARLPFTRAHQEEQFAPEFRPRELPAPWSASAVLSDWAPCLNAEDRQRP